MTLEHTIQNQIRVAVSNHGCILIRTNTGRVFTKDGRTFDAGPPKGWPDLTGVVKATGQIILIEVKNETGRLRPEQKQFAEFITKQVPNAIYGVARSAADAIRIIDEGIERGRRSGSS